VTGFGHTGPKVDSPGHDLNYIGLTGALALAGEADGPPQSAAVQVADIGGGALMAVFGILTALRERERSGRGQFVDVSMFDGVMSWMTLFAARIWAGDRPPRRGRELMTGNAICYRAYRCNDGWVSIGAMEAKFWEAWCVGVGRPDLVAEQYAEPGSEAHRQVEEIFAQRTRDEWAAFGAEHLCCLEPILELDEALESELVRARGLLVEFEQPGAGRIRGLGSPVRLGRTPARMRRGAPSSGEHTRAVLVEAGYGERDIAELEALGAVVCA
jgi:crotonobetainyl-CoA:carnitine CoA-transferase CaiB-like acyl-CoA transferase